MTNPRNLEQACQQFSLQNSLCETVEDQGDEKYVLRYPGHSLYLHQFITCGTGGCVVISSSELGGPRSATKFIQLNAANVQTFLLETLFQAYICHMDPSITLQVENIEAFITIDASKQVALLTMEQLNHTLFSLYRWYDATNFPTYFRNTIDVVHKMHKLNIMHGDLHTGNVGVALNADRSERYCIFDWGRSVYDPIRYINQFVEVRNSFIDAVALGNAWPVLDLANVIYNSFQQLNANVHSASDLRTLVSNALNVASDLYKSESVIWDGALVEKHIQKWIELFSIMTDVQLRKVMKYDWWEISETSFLGYKHQLNTDLTFQEVKDEHSQFSMYYAYLWNVRIAILVEDHFTANRSKIFELTPHHVKSYLHRESISKYFVDIVDSMYPLSAEETSIITGLDNAIQSNNTGTIQQYLSTAPRQMVKRVLLTKAVQRKRLDIINSLVDSGGVYVDDEMIVRLLTAKKYDFVANLLGKVSTIPFNSKMVNKILVLDLQKHQEEGSGLSEDIWLPIIRGYNRTPDGQGYSSIKQSVLGTLVEYEYTDSVELILSSGFRFNRRSNFLIPTIEKTNVRLVCVLLCYGADDRLRDGIKGDAHRVAAQLPPSQEKTEIIAKLNESAETRSSNASETARNRTLFNLTTGEG